MIGFNKDKEFSDIFLPQICAIVGPLLLEPAPIEMDQTEATDLKILKARDLRIACRVRRGGYADCYPNDFTIRLERPSGAKTELAKILDGFCDLSFYGHAGRGGAIDRYFVIDLDIFREALKQDQHGSYIKYSIQRNRDNSSSFIAFDIRSFPSWMLKKSSHPIAFYYEDAA